MAKGKRRQVEQQRRNQKKSAAYKAGGGESRYAVKHRGGGNASPGGMWVPAGTPGGVTRHDLDRVDEQCRYERLPKPYFAF